MKSQSVTIQMKATEEYFRVVSTVTMLFKVVLTFEICRQNVNRKPTDELNFTAAHPARTQRGVVSPPGNSIPSAFAF